MKGEVFDNLRDVVVSSDYFKEGQCNLLIFLNPICIYIMDAIVIKVVTLKLYLTCVWAD